MDNAEIDIRMSALTDLVDCFEVAGAPGYTLDSRMTHAVMCNSIRECVKVLEANKVNEDG